MKINCKKKVIEQSFRRPAHVVDIIVCTGREMVQGVNARLEFLFFHTTTPPRPRAWSLRHDVHPSRPTNVCSETPHLYFSGYWSTFSRPNRHSPYRVVGCPPPHQALVVLSVCMGLRVPLRQPFPVNHCRDRTNHARAVVPFLVSLSTSSHRPCCIYCGLLLA